MLGATSLLLAGCQEPPPNNKGTTATTPTPTNTGTTTSTTSTTFPTDTTFGATNDVVPGNWLNVMEVGSLDMIAGAGGTLELTEIVDDYDTMYGPDCLAAWTLSTSDPNTPSTCQGCDAPIRVDFALALGDPGPCQSPELPPDANSPGWKMAWHPGDQTIYRSMFGTGVWVAWWPGVKTGDTVDFVFQDSWAIFVDDETTP